MRSETKKEFGEWLQWYNWQRGCSMPLEQRIKFQDRAIHGLFRLVCALYDELDETRSRLYLPSGLKFDGPLKTEHRSE